MDLSKVDHFISAINGDLSQANKLLLETSKIVFEAGGRTVYKGDQYYLSNINRAISLNKAFELLISAENSLTAVSLVRLQIDNAIRLFALNLVEDPNKFLEHFFSGGRINLYKESKDQLSDNFLCTKLNDIYPGTLKLYKELCEYVHFSHKHFDATKGESINPDALFRITIGESEILNDIQKVEFREKMILISVIIFKLTLQWISIKEAIFQLPQHLRDWFNELHSKNKDKIK